MPKTYISQEYLNNREFRKMAERQMEAHVLSVAMMGELLEIHWKKKEKSR